MTHHSFVHNKKKTEDGMPRWLKWQKWEEALVIKMTMAGRQPAEIVEHLPARTLSSLQTFMSRRSMFDLAPPPAVRSKVRPKGAAVRQCMCCRRNFVSSGIGNRLCIKCNEAATGYLAA